MNYFGLSPSFLRMAAQISEQKRAWQNQQNTTYTAIPAVLLDRLNSYNKFNLQWL
jgi:hypothetical protein